MKEVNRNGVVFRVVSDTPDSTFWDINGWESSNYLILKEMCENHKLFVHAGAWIGPFTLYAAQIFEKVYCLEPDPVAYLELKRNIEINGYTNITLENNAFFENETKLIIGSDYSDLGRSGTSMFQKSNSIEVETITLMNYFKKHNLPSNVMLMLDVEGAEYCLFSDFDFFDKYKPTILVSFHLNMLNDEQYQKMYESLSNLTKIYNIDLDFIHNERAVSPFGSNFRGFDLLFTLK